MHNRFRKIGLTVMSAAMILTGCANRGHMGKQVDVSEQVAQIAKEEDTDKQDVTRQLSLDEVAPDNGTEHRDATVEVRENDIDKGENDTQNSQERETESVDVIREEKNLDKNDSEQNLGNHNMNRNRNQNQAEDNVAENQTEEQDTEIPQQESTEIIEKMENKNQGNTCLTNDSNVIIWDKIQQVIGIPTDQDIQETEKTDSSNSYEDLSGNSQGENLNDSQNSYVTEVLRLVNEERQKNGLTALTLSQQLCNVAEIRANEITVSFSHTRPNGSSCFTVLAEQNVPYMACGENLAYGQRSPQEVVTGWMNSPGHRANILSSRYHKIGIGVVQKSGVYYWSQMFTD